MKRFISIIVSCIISSLMCFSAYAFGFEDEAYDYTSGTVAKSIVYDESSPHYYKIVLTSDGKLDLKVTMDSNVLVKILDEDGEKKDSISVWIDYRTGLAVATMNKSLAKGTYYIGIWNTGSNSGEYKFSATFPSNSTDKTATGAYPAIYLSSGDSIGLGAVVSNTVRDDVTISTSNRRVAKVNSYGYVTAVKKGTAVITIKYGRTSTKLCVVVE